MATEFPGGLSGLSKWFAGQVELFREFPSRNPTYWRVVEQIVDGPMASVVRRAPNPTHVAARIGLAQRTIDTAHRWLERHGFYEQPDWPRNLHRAEVSDDWPKRIHEDRADAELSTLLKFLRALEREQLSKQQGEPPAAETSPAKRGRKKADYDTREEAALAADQPAVKRSTEKGEARIKLIAALTKHHQYADGGCLNTAPIGSNALAEAAGVSDGAASGFFKNEFGGHVKYKARCQDAKSLADALKVMRGEYTPAELSRMIGDAFQAGRQADE